MNSFPEVDTYKEELVQWRRHIHAHPETAFEEVQTAAFIAEKLREFGVDELHEQFAQTGVVAVIKGELPGERYIGLRADMDALDLKELNDFSHCSTHEGKMHACGHDGHTTMLLGAAKYLCSNRQFPGKIALIFQPAEENEGGARHMVEEGLFEKFPVDEIYGMHNWPGVEAGTFCLSSGPVMASFDSFDLTIIAKGGHAAMPHQCIDPILLSTQIIQAWQTIISRQKNPLEPAVLSVTQIHAGDAYNVIPEQVEIKGTVRTFDVLEQERIKKAMFDIANGLCESQGSQCSFKYSYGYPATINTDKAIKHAQNSLTRFLPKQAQITQTPSMGSEDFAFMLQEKPGAYIWLGNGPGESGCMLHNPHYDFNDEVSVTGVKYWLSIVFNFK